MAPAALLSEEFLDVQVVLAVFPIDLGHGRGDQFIDVLSRNEIGAHCHPQQEWRCQHGSQRLPHLPSSLPFLDYRGRGSCPVPLRRTLAAAVRACHKERSLRREVYTAGR
jgi:hypothetical protein